MLALVATGEGLVIVEAQARSVVFRRLLGGEAFEGAQWCSWGTPIDVGVGGVEGGAFRGSIRMGGFDAADLLVSAIFAAR